MLETYAALAERALAGEAPSDDQCRWILDADDVELLPLLHAAFEPRRKHFGRKVMVHVLNNVQNGLCPEDCGYCSQNKDSEAAIRKYAMKSEDEILAEAEAAARSGATRYCMVMSGRGPTSPCSSGSRPSARLPRPRRGSLPRSSSRTCGWRRRSPCSASSSRSPRGTDRSARC